MKIVLPGSLRSCECQGTTDRYAGIDFPSFDGRSMRGFESAAMPTVSYTHLDVYKRQMQYQVLLDPARIYGYHLTIPQVVTALSANNANAGGGFYSQGGQFYYVRGIGLVRNTDDIGNIVAVSYTHLP